MLMPLDMLRAGEWAEVEEVSGHPPGSVGSPNSASGRGAASRWCSRARRVCWTSAAASSACAGECSQILVRPVS